MKLNTENTTCRNCGVEMPKHSLYCPKCSQKNTDGRIPIFAFVKDLFENLLNIDSRLFQTALGLFIPGKLTNEFFRGKHKSFATPSRLFLATALLFFAMVSFVVQKDIADENFQGNIFGINSFSKNKDQLLDIEKVRKEFGEMITPQMEAKLDSIESEIHRLDTNFVDVKISLKEYHFKTSDFENLSADSMIQKYEIEGIVDQVFFKQGHKLTKNPKSLVTTIIGNLTWMMLILVPTMALILKLLYIRSNRYYVEHLVFLFHFHAFFLLIGAIHLSLQYFFDFEIENTLALGIGAVLFLYILFSFKNVYQQSWLKTLFKMFLVSISYLITFVISIIFISIVSFLLF